MRSFERSSAVLVNGKIIFNSPVFTGNAKRKLFTRKSSDLSVKLPGKPEYSDIAKSKMDTLQTRFDDDFTYLFDTRNYSNDIRFHRGSGNRRDWYYSPLIDLHFTDALNKKSQFFDLRQGICINRDTQTMIKGRNYSIEAVFKDMQFNFSFDIDRLTPTDKYKALVILNEWKEGRFFFGENKSRGLGWGQLDIDSNTWKTLTESLTVNKSNIEAYNREANYIEISLQFPLSDPLLVNWNHNIFCKKNNRNITGEFYIKDGDDEKGNAILELERGLNGHNKKIEEASSSKDRRAIYQQSMYPYKEFRVSKENFKQAARNDKNTIEFFKQYGQSLRDYLDGNEYKDYREMTTSKNVEGYNGKVYDKLPVRLGSLNGFSQIYIPGSTLKGAFRSRAQQIIKTLFHQQFWCKVATSNTLQDQPCDQKCPVCRLFGTTKFANDNNPLRSRIFFRDAYPYDNDKIQLYPIDNVPICRLSGKGLNKSNLLFAYGPEAYMETRILIKNIKSNDRWILALLGHILKDFYYGDIPVGSGKFCGLGRLHGNVTSIKVGCHKDTWLYNTLHSLGHTPETGFFWEEAVFNPFTVSNYTAVLDDLQTSFIALGGVK